MITQLRPFYTPEERELIYSHPYGHTRREDHHIRVGITIHIARWLRDHLGATTAADLSCGDGAILTGLHLPRSMCTYGDLVSAPHLDINGPIEETILSAPQVDLFILSETLEDVEDPGLLLRKARLVCRGIIVSTPVDEMGDDNPEHYWGWGVKDIRKLLIDAGFNPTTLTLLDAQIPGGYTHQIWGCT